MCQKRHIFFYKKIYYSIDIYVMMEYYTYEQMNICRETNKVSSNKNGGKVSNKQHKLRMKGGNIWQARKKNS